MIFLLEVKIKGSFNGRLEPPVWGRDTSVWGPWSLGGFILDMFFVEFLSVKRVGWQIGGLGIPVGFEFMSCFFLIQVGFVELMFFRLLSVGAVGVVCCVRLRCGRLCFSSSRLGVERGGLLIGIPWSKTGASVGLWLMNQIQYDCIAEAGVVNYVVFSMLLYIFLELLK